MSGQEGFARKSRDRLPDSRSGLIMGESCRGTVWAWDGLAKKRD
jgi:hypothetical protein